MTAASYTGTAVIDGPIRLEITVSPPVGAPRDTLELQLKIANDTSSYETPQVQIGLPSTLRLESKQLPAGVTKNISENSLQWLPVVPTSGGTRELTLPLAVNAADLTNPEQKISVQLTAGGDVKSATTTVWIGIPPHVVGLDNPTHVSVGQPVVLNAEAQGPGPISETWDLGDGRRIAVSGPTVVYPISGVYDVTVTAHNPIGSASYTSQITVVPHVNADFLPEDKTPGLDTAVTFLNVGGGQQPVQYQWDFGDGTTSTEADPTHVFSKPGTYLVQLVAENAFGKAESSQTVTVGVPPVADVVVAESAPAGSQLAGEVVIDSVSTVSTEFTWEMGDGRRYAGAKVRHIYRQSGDYFVTMTASNEFGETQVGQWVHVEKGTLHAYMPMVSNFSVSVRGSSVASIPELANTSAVDARVSETFVMEPIEFTGYTLPVDQLLAYINEARSQFDLSPLGVSETLSIAATKHTDDMAAAEHNQHTGSDGSIPADRFLQFGYGGGYAGEATAWGFADPRQAVEFWVNSPGHRPIVLNRYATEVGLGYTVDYTAPSVWYWTAEFGNGIAAADAPAMRVQTPSTGLEVLNSEEITFIWNWPTALAPSEQFTVYLQGQGELIPVGTVSEPDFGTRYTLSFKPATMPDVLGEYQWQVRLENNRGAEIASGEPRTVTINLDPDLPTATPVPTQAPTQEATAVPTATPTAASTTEAPTPRPTETPLPIFVTATPVPAE
jgi:uncharacterized protein YkwD